jgi:hypothetical protein
MKIIDKMLCEIFGHRWGLPNKQDTGSDGDIWIEEYCERKTCDAIRSGLPGRMDLVHPNNFLTGKPVVRRLSDGNI